MKVPPLDTPSIDNDQNGMVTYIGDRKPLSTFRTFKLNTFRTDDEEPA